MKAWRCAVCGYVHRGDEPPAECPVCGAPREEFELYEEAAARQEQPVADGGKGRVIVLGGGIAGLSAVESLRQARPEQEIILLSREKGLPYYRLNLTRYLAGEISTGQLPIHPASWYASKQVELLDDAEADELDLEQMLVRLTDGRDFDFDTLILTAGAQPFVPPVPGAALSGVTTLRTQDDADMILQAIQAGARCVVVGGGILGLETAGAIARRGGHVMLLESHEWLMPRQLNRRAGELLAGQIEKIGIELVTRAQTDQILGRDKVEKIQLKNGASLSAELVVLATGVRPNSHLARQAGLDVEQGVVVDDYLLTSHPKILAAGDIAQHRGTLYGNWGVAQFQGSIAGMNAGGARVEFGGVPRSNSLKVLGLDLVSMGQFEAPNSSYQVLEEERGDEYRRLVFHDGRLVGAVLMGNASQAAGLKKALESRRDFSKLLQQQVNPGLILECLTQD